MTAARSITRRTRWPILLLEFSPLIAVAYLAAVFAVVPMTLAAQLFAYKAMESRIPEQYAVEIDPEVMAAEWFMYTNNPTGMGVPDEDSPMMQFESVKRETYRGLTERIGDFYGKPGPESGAVWPADDPLFSALAKWESENEWPTWLFFLPDPPAPAIAARAETAPGLLPTAEDMELVPSKPKDVIGWLWMQNRGYLKYPAWDLSGMSGGGSTSDDKRTISESAIFDGEDFYKVYLVSPPDPNGGVDIQTELGGEIKPTASDFQQKIETLAEEHDGNAYVLGPIEIEPVVLREPEGQEGSGKRVVESLWPDKVFDGGIGGMRADAELAEALGGYEWFAPSSGMGSEGEMTEESFSPGSLLFVSASKRNNTVVAAEQGVAESRRPWRRFQLRMAANAIWLLGFGVALLGASLVASPAAFIYDRKREAQARVLAEMQRVQQDAHDKVYNRLSALSKRAEITSATVSDSVARSMGALAEDIRKTVTELQQILGDAERVSAVAPVQSSLLVEQITNACRAQAERLAAEIVVSASALPEVDPQVGWDVQCIVEEAVNNAVVRGEATRVDVMLRAGQDAIVVEVADDGHGLPEGFGIDMLPEGSTGLRGMRNRVERRGGTLRLERRERGTRLRARVPLG